MKLKRLIIENIASIEKAEINFEEAPLADSPIFLIFQMWCSLQCFRQLVLSQLCFHW